LLTAQLLANKQISGVAFIGGPTFNPPGGNLRSKNNIHSKEEEQEEPKSLPPDAFSGLQICQNYFCGLDPARGASALPQTP